MRFQKWRASRVLNRENEKTPLGLVSSHRFVASLFYRVTSLYKTSLVLAIPFPLKTKNATAPLNIKPD